MATAPLDARHTALVGKARRCRALSSRKLCCRRLQQNYEVAEGVCIPRNTLYLHYVDFCARNAMQPVNAASFGKARLSGAGGSARYLFHFTQIIRQQFPQLTTRRLGTRGQSRYHYYGIAVRVGSLYFEPPYAKG